MRRAGLLLLVLAFAGGLGGATACATARHHAVQIDAAFAQAVFAVDDTQRELCRTAVLTADACAASSPKILQALEHVRALTLAIQATPKDGTVPITLPNLLADLVAIQQIVEPFKTTTAAPLAAKVSEALVKAAAVLTAIAGGVS